MIDITSKIADAVSLAHGWTREKVRHAVSALAELYPDGIVDCEESDEDWGRVISCGEATAYISARCPLAFVKADSEATAQWVSSALCILAIAAPDFDAPSFSIDPSVLSELTRRPLTKNVSYDRVSVNEIWWATL